MKRNVGPIDRLLRILIGLTIAIFGVIYESYWGIVGILILATGVFGYCLIYGLFKMNTNRKNLDSD